jgi:hypothetical protein
MSKKDGKDDDDKKDPILERVVTLETTVKFHEQRLENLEKGLGDIKTTLEEVLQTTKGLNFFFKSILLPVVISVITAIILRVAVFH